MCLHLLSMYILKRRGYKELKVPRLLIGSSLSPTQPVEVSSSHDTRLTFDSLLFILRYIQKGVCLNTGGEEMLGHSCSSCHSHLSQGGFPCSTVLPEFAWPMLFSLSHLSGTFIFSYVFLMEKNFSS